MYFSRTMREPFERRVAGVLAAFLVIVMTGSALADPLPSWAPGEAKKRIVDFVEEVTNPDSPKFVPVKKRIATFDNDGNLWAEQPFYFQLQFAMDYLAERAKADPSLLSSPVLKAAAAGDVKTVMAGGEKALLEVVSVSHSGMTVEAYIARARTWLRTAKHPKTGRPYGEHIYQPMLELLSYLRDKDFKTFVVSGGGIHFIRAFAEEVYGIPPEQVIGSVAETSYKVIDGKGVIMKEPGIAFIDDKAGKPVGIDRVIGRRPILASGNSDGDFQMLEWTTGGDGARLALLLHHTDAAREWAYDRKSHIGKLARGLDEGPGRGWVIIDMAKDWKAVFPPAY